MKEGKLETWKAWCVELASLRRDEALLTLDEEKVTEEMCLLVELSGVHYVVGFSEGEMLPANMSREINLKHKAMKADCLKYVRDAEVLYHLKK